MLVVTVLFLAIILYFFLKKKRTKCDKSFPQPPGNILLGHILHITSTTHILDGAKNFLSYGDTVTLRFGPDICPVRKGLLTQDHSLIEFMLSNNNLIKKSENYKFLKKWLGNGLLVSDGDYWKRRRKILTAAFHFEILKKFVEVFESAGDVLIEKLQEYDEDTSVDLHTLTTLYALDVICETAMGTKINAQSGHNIAYVQSVRNMCKTVIERAFSPFKIHDVFYWLTRDYYKQQKALKILHGFTMNVINSKKDRPVRNDEKKTAFLDALLKFFQKDDYLSISEIREEVDTFMFEGHDTTASGISFALYCLADHPEVQEKVFQEQKEIFGDRKKPATTYSDLQQMKYLECVLKETLRLYPSVPVIGRHTTEEINFDGYVIPKNTNIVIFIYGLHRNQDYFPEPEKFKPERFENIDNAFSFSYIPFSAGSRNCIGQKFAMLEMKSVISKIVRQFEIKPTVPRHEVQLSPETVLKSGNGVKVTLKKRD
ncbi:hypothetical protein Zmor_015512 [Zophobas morio]|uniref:Cytochrome P450 n=1 Tax=Zophobas morio TaxID=2755281 RepID=A0AA38IGX8_9CUCU|nr:hypothetical protein Zmor_015512 [Zophobas morio]